jgi:hypothetical protein
MRTGTRQAVRPATGPAIRKAIVEATPANALTLGGQILTLGGTPLTLTPP